MSSGETTPESTYDEDEEVHIKDLGSETSKDGAGPPLENETGSPRHLVLEETGDPPLQSLSREASGAGRSATDSRCSGPLPDKLVDVDVESAPAARVGSGLVSGSESRSSRQTSTSSELRMHLDRKEKEEEEIRVAKKKARDEEVAKVRRKMEEEKRKKGIQILPGSRDSRGVIKAFLSEEEVMAMEYRQQELEEESEEMKEEIEAKFGFSDKKRPQCGLVDIAAEFYSGAETPSKVLPERIRRSLTTQEIKDLKLVFDMFDAKGRGYIISFDLRRAAGMLGFKAKKQVFNEMIDELATEQKGKVTFMNFLDFIIKSQGDGPDPFDEITQCFRLLDTEEKGFLTFSDLRSACDHAHLSLSNKALREMLQEADLTGDGRITEIEFVRIMMETNTFRLTNKNRKRLK